MKITSFSVQNYPPIQSFDIQDLTDTVVLAGPNGVGKTSLMVALLHHFQHLKGMSTTRAVVQATNSNEEADWGKPELRTEDPEDAKILLRFLQRNQTRSSLQSSLLNYDSARRIEQIQPYAFDFKVPDPWKETVGWNTGYQPMSSRFQDTIHSLHRKIRRHKDEVANQAIALQAAGEESMRLEFADPLEKFAEAFSKLLPGKKLEELDNQQSNSINYSEKGKVLPLTSLSSGERELVSIVFDFLLRNPKDCIILFDEPELHLHPELTYRLLRILRESGERNQFILSTHSPDIITATLDQSVVFIAPPRETGTNQAIQLKDDSDTAKILRLIGQSVGVISLGKRIVLIEGTSASIDKQTYGSLVESAFPEFVLVPAGGKHAITSFMKAIDSILNKAIWGVDFFMLCDGDNLDAVTESGYGDRLRVLPRCHIENYFLDEHVLAHAFEKLGEAQNSWLLRPEKIRDCLRSLALAMLSYTVALRVSHRLRFAAGNVDMMPSDCHGIDDAKLASLFERQRVSELARINAGLTAETVDKLVRDEFRMLSTYFDSDSDEWQRVVPGKPVFQKFASAAKTDPDRLRRVYIRSDRELGSDVFKDIKDIFSSFTKV